MHSTHKEDDEAVSLAGVSASSPARRSGQTVIPFQDRTAAACLVLEEASSPDWEVPPTIGELAVKLVATWSRPRVVCWRQGEEPAASAEQPIWEG